jgi:cytoskeleton protein RodZ
VASFGMRLKQEREKKSVTLDDISLTTKISTRMLRALEEEQFDQLPGGIFNKGFIRAYARCLGMDEDQAVADYLAATTVSPPGKKLEDNDQAPLIVPPSREEFGEQFRENSGGTAGLPWGTLAVVLLIAALGFTAWGFYSRQTQNETRAPAANSPNVSPVAVADRSPSPPPNESAAAPVAVAQPNQPTISSPAAGQSTQAPAPSTQLSSPDQVPSPTPQAGRFTVQIKAREDSWLSVSIDGEVSTHGMLSAPAEKSVRAAREITVKAGNIGALDFEFNGRKLPAQGGYGEVKTLTFDANGLRPPAPKPQEPVSSPSPTQENPKEP